MPVPAGALGASGRRVVACRRLLGLGLLVAAAGCTAERPEPASPATASFEPGAVTTRIAQTC